MIWHYIYLHIQWKHILFGTFYWQDWQVTAHHVQQVVWFFCQSHWCAGTHSTQVDQVGPGRSCRCDGCGIMWLMCFEIFWNLLCYICYCPHKHYKILQAMIQYYQIYQAYNFINIIILLIQQNTIMFGTFHWPITSHHSDVLACFSYQWDLAISWPVLQILQMWWPWHYVVDVFFWIHCRQCHQIIYMINMINITNLDLMLHMFSTITFKSFYVFGPVTSHHSDHNVHHVLQVKHWMENR